MFIVQQKCQNTLYKWKDRVKKRNKKAAKEFIESEVEEGGRAENYRIAEEVAKCQTKVIWEDVSKKDCESEEKQLKVKEVQSEEIDGDTNIKVCTTDKEKQLLLDFLGKTIELQRFPKKTDLDDDDDLYSYNTYYNILGSKSNICDMVIQKITQDIIDKDFMKVLKRQCNKCENNTDECGNHPTNCLLDAVKEKKERNWDYSDE